jgi:hypothetical protein
LPRIAVEHEVFYFDPWFYQRNKSKPEKLNFPGLKEIRVEWKGRGWGQWNKSILEVVREEPDGQNVRTKVGQIRDRLRETGMVARDTTGKEAPIQGALFILGPECKA